jgi:hypothetical protein
MVAANGLLVGPEGMDELPAEAVLDAILLDDDRMAAEPPVRSET